MSGGCMDYIYCKLECNVCGRMLDLEMNDMMADLVKVLHDLEWYLSADISEAAYKKTVREFKQKWFEEPRTLRLRTYVDQSVDNLKTELYDLIGTDNGSTDKG